MAVWGEIIALGENFQKFSIKVQYSAFLSEFHVHLSRYKEMQLRCTL